MIGHKQKVARFKTLGFVLPLVVTGVDLFIVASYYSVVD
jgi:hypothetical protein